MSNRKLVPVGFETDDTEGSDLSFDTSMDEK
jgi:hypothetical protein